MSVPVYVVRMRLKYNLISRGLQLEVYCCMDDRLGLIMCAH